MNQKQYLRTLNRNLYLYVSREERQDILADYREYFSDALSNGESETDLMKHLGSPAAVAKEILADRGIFTISKQVILKALSFLIALILFGFIVWIFYYSFCSFEQNAFHDFLSQNTPVIVLLIAIANFFLRAHPWRGKPNDKNRPFWIVSASVSAFVLLSVVLSVTLYLVPVIQGWLPYPDYDISVTGPTMALIFMMQAALLFLAWLWLLVGSRNASPMCQSLNFWFAGLIGMFSTGRYILSNLDDPEYLFSFMIWINWLWPFAVGTVLTGIAMLVSYLLGKRGK